MGEPDQGSLRCGGSRVRSVVKALKTIDLLAEARGELTLGEIAGKLGLPKSTVHGLLSTLRDHHYIDQSAFTGKYRLGLRLFELGNVVARTLDVRSVAGPYIQELVDESGETAHLVILEKGEVLYIDKRESRHSLRIVSEIGMRLPAHCTGVGKVLLAYLTPAEVRTIVIRKGLPRFTRHTITDPKKLEEELIAIRRQGYAVDNEEIMEGLRCVAAPIRDHSGKVVAAVSVSGPSARLSGESLERFVKLVTDTALRISNALGLRSLDPGGE